LEEFERNLCVIANNTNRNGQAVQVPFVRSGAAGWSAAMRHCGRKLKVRYRSDIAANQYYCVRPIEEDNAGKVCTIISGGHLDRAASEALLQILEPLDRVALAAIDSGQDRYRISADKPN